MVESVVDQRRLVRSESRTIRVASIPAGHVYVRHLQPEGFLEGYADIERLADPDPDIPSRPAQSRWWPPVMLQPNWVREELDFDVMHLQFGFDAQTPEQLAEWVSALRETGRPLVYTVHDLRNPHHLDRSLHDAQLDVLIPSADALITLTPGAAREIAARWGREAQVIPHPHVVDFETMRSVSRPRSAQEFRVGVHVKSLRASMNPMPVLETLADSVSRIPGGVLQVNGHHDVLDEGGANFEPELASFLREGADSGRLDLHVHDFLEDDELWKYLASISVSVLPYRFGTHSGWLEACRDLGTTVIAPSCGYYRDQGPVIEYVHEENTFDPESLDRAVHVAYREGAPQPASVSWRASQRSSVAAAHSRVYERLVS